jgi:hypothetical protein
MILEKKTMNYLPDVCFLSIGPQTPYSIQCSLCNADDMHRSFLCEKFRLLRVIRQLSFILGFSLGLF